MRLAPRSGPHTETTKQQHNTHIHLSRKDQRNGGHVSCVETKVSLQISPCSPSSITPCGPSSLLFPEALCTPDSQSSLTVTEFITKATMWRIERGSQTPAAKGTCFGYCWLAVTKTQQKNDCITQRTFCSIKWTERSFRKCSHLYVRVCKVSRWHFDNCFYNQTHLLWSKWMILNDREAESTIESGKDDLVSTKLVFI